jgi:hypothetical protein
MAKILKVKEGDIGPILALTLAKPDGTVWNLTDSTVTVVLSGGNTPTIMSKVATLTVAASGTCHCHLTSTDTLIAGEYRLEATINYSSSAASTGKYTTVTQGDLIICETL